MTTPIVVKPAGMSVIEFPFTRNYFADMDALTSQIAQRAFNLFQERGAFPGSDLEDWLRAETEILKPVPIEVTEANDSYTVKAEVPGFDMKELSVQADLNSVYIHGKTEQKKEGKEGKDVKYSEVSANELSRRIALPSSINPEKASAHLANGVLELTLPKAAPPKKLEIKVAA